MVDLPYTLTNLKQNKQMKLNKQRSHSKFQVWTSCNKLVITPSIELQIQFCKLYWKVNLIIFPMVYNLHITYFLINTSFILNFPFLHLI